MHETNDHPDRPEPTEPANHGYEYPQGYSDVDGVTAEESSDGDDTSDDLPPPANTPGEDTAEPPERGQALREIINFAASYGAPEAADAHHETLPGISADESDKLRDQVQGIVFGNEEMPASEAAIIQIGAVREEYASQLRKAGLELFMNLEGGVHPVIADPSAFSEALEQIEVPTTAEDIENTNNAIGSAIEATLVDAAGSIRQSDPVAALTAIGDNLTAQLDLRLDLADELEPNSIEIAARMVANADRISQRIEELGCEVTTIESVRIIEVARQEGKIVEWAVGEYAGVVSNSHYMIGVERVNTPESWSQVYGYLEQLQQTAPDSRFTALVADTLLTDIDFAIASIEQANAPEKRAELGPNDTDYLDSLRETVYPMLHEGRARICQIFGIDNS